MIPLNTVIRGDALKELPAFPAEWAQAIIADPPYYNVLKEDWDTQWEQVSEYLDWSLVWVSECMRILKTDGLCFICGQLGKREHGFLHLMSQLCMKFQFHDLIIWDRVVGYNERRDSLTPAYEMILVLRKSDAVKFRKDRIRVPYDAKTIELYLRDKRYKDRDARLMHLSRGKFATNILSVPSLKGSSKEKCGHPSQKPLELIEKLILMSTDEGDIVLDPFLGSGTTALAAEEHRRLWVGIEKDQAYCQSINKRLAEVRGLFSLSGQNQEIENPRDELGSGPKRDNFSSAAAFP
jgi:site-specific DNA-methyltransferase (adenine-specific)